MSKSRGVQVNFGSVLWDALQGEHGRRELMHEAVVVGELKGRV